MNELEIRKGKFHVKRSITWKDFTGNVSCETLMEYRKIVPREINKVKKQKKFHVKPIEEKGKCST